MRSLRLASVCLVPHPLSQPHLHHAPSTQRPSPALPASFAGGRYQVQRFLGEGGRKRVYRGRDDRLDRDVAIGRRPA